MQMKFNNHDIPRGYWEFIEIKGAAVPCSRESTKMVPFGRSVYLFGGHSMFLHNDFRELIDCEDHFYAK